jgi:predicted alpha/beta superfamily hydrolase
MKFTIVAVAVAIGAAEIAAAQDTTLSPWRREAITSARLGEERQLIIATPEGYANDTTRRFPVLVLLDANDAAQFRAAVANAAFLASRDAIAPVIVVGIPNGRDRTRDMTPAARGEAAKNFPTAGGAADFAGFITDEVLPHVRANYRTLPMTMLAGHSFGGIFALHVAANHATAFHGIVAASPSLWWNDTTSAMAYADSIARLSRMPRLFVSSGALEPPIDAATRKFVARFEKVKPGHAGFAARHYPRDDHGLTPAVSLADGLRFVFEPVSLQRMPIASLMPGTDSASIVRMLAATDREYARGARGLGLPEVVPEQVLNQVGYYALQFMKKPDFAATIFQRNVDRYPGSANVYDSLADALIAKGDSAAARVALRRAVDLATQTRHSVLQESTRKLRALDQAVQAGSQRPD